MIEHYGDASRIGNDTITALARKMKPSPGFSKDMYKFYSEIVVSILRLERLTKEKLIDTASLNECLHSRSTLHLLISLLPAGDFTELKREMPCCDIDHNNPLGALMFTCFNDFCMIERNAIESGLADEPEPQKPKTKTAYGARFISNESSSDESSMALHAAGTGTFTPKPWYPSGLWFPCPLDNHKQEMTGCTQFFGLCPKKRWNRIDRKRVCYTCMQPRDMWKGPKCSQYKKVPEILLCFGCAEIADK